MPSGRSSCLRRVALAPGLTTLTAPSSGQIGADMAAHDMTPRHDLCSRGDGELLSVHETSEGHLRYRRCSCGRIVVELLERNPPRRLGATPERGRPHP